MFPYTDGSMLGKMLERQATREATEQAQTEVDAIEASIKEALAKIGIDMYSVGSPHTLIAEVRKMRIESLVHARLQAVADALMAKPAKPAKHEVGKLTIAVEVDDAALKSALEKLSTLAAETKRIGDQLDRVTEGGNAMRTSPV